MICRFRCFLGIGLDWIGLDGARRGLVVVVWALGWGVDVGEWRRLDDDGDDVIDWMLGWEEIGRFLR